MAHSHFLYCFKNLQLYFNLVLLVFMSKPISTIAASIFADIFRLEWRFAGHLCLPYFSNFWNYITKGYILFTNIFTYVE